MSNNKKKKSRITREWFENFCRPRLTEKDRKILQFIYRQRLVTSKQIRDVFYKKNKSQVQCNARLHTLENELYCIKRFYLKTMPGEGKSYAHIVLDRGGYRALNLDNHNNIYSKLPSTYKHYLAVNDFCILANEKGWGWGITEYNMDVCISDIFYEEKRISVEIDMGTESHSLLEDKANRYNLLNNIGLIIFISNNQKRADRFISKVYSIQKKIAGVFEKQKDIVDYVTEKLY